MRAWLRAFGGEFCGRCGQAFEADAPMFSFTLPGVKRVKVRCALCAEDRPPADLPSLPDRYPVFAPMVHIASGPDVLPLKFASVGTEREPGCDDE